MKKGNISKNQWHVLLISFEIFVFSLLCWINLAKNCLSAVISYHESKERTNVIKEIQGGIDSESKTNILKDACDLLDSSIAAIDTQWYVSVFKKEYLSKIDGIYTFFTVGEISSRQVVKGEGKWLFYKSTIDADPIGDFEGSNKYSQDDMETITQNAKQTQEILSEQGIKFAIIVAPNKENIYAEFMPDTYIHSDISSTDLLIEYMAQNGINVISPKADLLANHSRQLYYLYDTHWNQLGAYIGVKNILDFWNIDIPDLADRNILSKNLKGNYHYCAEDDLAKMVGLRSIFNDEIEYEVDGTCLMDWKKFAAEQNNLEVSHYSNPNAEVEGKVLLVGDSFRASMLPSLREVFSEIYVVQRSYYTSELLNKIKPDYLISEYVERYSRQMGEIDLLVK